MPNNVAASMTASIVIDKGDLLAQILKGLSEGQKELENNKLEMYFDFSDSKNKAEFEKTLQKYKKQLASNDFVVKIENEGIEETVKSLDKLLDVVKSIASGKGFGTGSGNGNGIGNSIVDENQLKTVIDLFTKMESSLASIKKIFVDVGDGEEFSPLFSMINKINSSISELSSSVKSIGLNMNIDVGSDTELEAKIQSKMSNALQAYQRLFEHIKMSGVGGSMVNTNFFEFDINQFDTMMAKIQAYRKFIENMRNQVKSEFGGKDLLYTETDKKYWTSAASAMGQLTKAQNEMNKSADANPLDDLFGKTDLTGVIEQLNLIVSKLDEISVAATKFSETFSQGLNVTTSVEEVTKLTEKVKELEAELAKVKSVSTGSTETNISSDNKTTLDAKKELKEYSEGLNYTNEQLDKLNGLDEKLFDSIAKGEISAREALNKIQVELQELGNKAESTSDKISNIFVHFGTDFDNSKFEKIKNRIDGLNKPGKGFWGSYLDSEYGWEQLFEDPKKYLTSTYFESNDSKEWFASNEPNKILQSFYKLKEDAHVLVLETVEDLQQLPSRGLNSAGKALIDWEKIAEQYDAISVKISNSTNEFRQAMYGWDADSLVVTNPNAIIQVDAPDYKAKEIEIAKQIDLYKQLKKEASMPMPIAIQSEDISLYNSYKNIVKSTEKELKLGTIDANTALEKQQEILKGTVFYNDKWNKLNPTKDAFQGNTTASSAESTNAIQKENNALAETAENAEKAATSKKKFSQANEKVKETADESVSSIKDEANAFSQAEWDKNVKVIQDYMNAVSKLNNLKASDKGTGRKSNQIETQIKEVESLKDAAYEARQNLSSMINPHSVDIDTWEKFVQVMRQFSQASSGSAESVAKLEDALQNVKTSIVNSVHSSIDGYNKKLANLSATPADFNQSEKYRANLKELKEQISQFEAFRDQIASKDTITEEDIQSIAKYKSNIEDATRAITSMTAAEKGSTSLSRDKLYNKIGDYMKKNSGLSKQFRVELQKLQKQLTMRGANANVSDLTDEFLKLQIRIREAGEEGKKFWDVVKEKAWYGAASQIGMAFGVNDIIRYGQQIANTVIQLDTATTELRKVSDATDKRLVTNFENSAKTAKELGSTISDVISATADWSRMGYDIDQSEELARVSTLYKNVGDGIDIETANNSLISTLQGFQLDASEAESIIDKFNEVANNYAIDSAGIGEALQRSAASFNAANTDLSKSIALITATNEVVQDPDSVGTLWKTMSARIRGAETELSQLNEETDEYTKTTSKLRDLVKSLTGFDIMADEDTFKDIYDIILGIGKEWSNLTDAEQSSLGEALAGKRNANALYAVLGNLDTLQNAYETAENSAGSAQREQENYQKSIQYSIDQTKAKLEELSNDLLSSDFLKGAIDAGGKLIDILDGIVKSGNAIPAVFAGIGAALSFKNVGILELY